MNNYSEKFEKMRIAGNLADVRKYQN